MDEKRIWEIVRDEIEKAVIKVDGREVARELVSEITAEQDRQANRRSRLRGE